MATTGPSKELETNDPGRASDTTGASPPETVDTSKSIKANPSLVHSINELGKVILGLMLTETRKESADGQTKPLRGLGLLTEGLEELGYIEEGALPLLKAFATLGLPPPPNTKGTAGDKTKPKKDASSSGDKAKPKSTKTALENPKDKRKGKAKEMTTKTPDPKGKGKAKESVSENPEPKGKAKAKKNTPIGEDKAKNKGVSAGKAKAKKPALPPRPPAPPVGLEGTAIVVHGVPRHRLLSDLLVKLSVLPEGTEINTLRWLLPTAKRTGKKAGSLVIYLNTETVPEDLIVKLGKNKMRITPYECDRGKPGDSGETTPKARKSPKIVAKGLESAKKPTEAEETLTTPAAAETTPDPAEKTPAPDKSSSAEAPATETTASAASADKTTTAAGSVDTTTKTPEKSMDGASKSTEDRSGRNFQGPDCRQS